MGDCRVAGKNSPPVKSPEEMVGRFQAELITALPGWKQRLTTNPGQLAEVERDVHAACSRGGRSARRGSTGRGDEERGFR